MACKPETGNLARARVLYKKAAHGGHAGAQDRLGETYEHGDLGLVTDEEVALKWFQKAADGGDSYAQCRLADAHEGGELSLLTNEQ